MTRRMLETRTNLFLSQANYTRQIQAATAAVGALIDDVQNPVGVLHDESLSFRPLKRSILPASACRSISLSAAINTRFLARVTAV
jgi:hypothetical protein